MTTIKTYVISRILWLIIALSAWGLLVFNFISYLNSRNFSLVRSIVFCIVTYTLVMWVVEIMPVVWHYISRKSACVIPKSAKLPHLFQIDLGEFHSRGSRVIVFFQNVSSDAVHGRITVKDASSNDVFRQVVLEEPEPLLVGTWGRKNGWWSRGTGTGRSPIVIDLNVPKVGTHALTLECDLDWNFVGTRLEEKIPKNRILNIEVG